MAAKRLKSFGSRFLKKILRGGKGEIEQVIDFEYFRRHAHRLKKLNSI